MKKIALVLVLSLSVLLAVGIGLFQYYHPTHYSFNDRYVLGNSAEAIIERYGKPYSITGDTVTYMIHDDTQELVMAYDNSLWYVIEMKDGVAADVYLREGRLGA